MSVTRPFNILDINLSGKPSKSWGFWSETRTTALLLFKK